MQKIKLKASATLIPVPTTIKAKKGDYLVINDENEIVVIDNKTFQALTRAEFVAWPGRAKMELHPPQVPRSSKQPSLNKTEKVKKLRETLLELLRQDLTTTAIMKKMLKSRPYVHDQYNSVYHALEHLRKDGLVESINIGTAKRPALLWGLKKGPKLVHPVHEESQING